MQGKTVVITGATSGIGLIAAEELAKKGARMIMVARDQARGEKALARMRTLAPGINHTVHYADLSRLREMKRVAAEIAAAEPRIDVLINNAGAIFNTRLVTEDGMEITFALNHVSYFVMAHGLRSRLDAGAPARVINTASHAHKGKQLDFNDLQSASNFRGYNTYGRSKLANILFTRELARRWAGTGISVNSLHPGFVSTRFGDESGGAFSLAIRAAKLFAISPQKGAETIVYLASSPDVAGVTGQYFYQCRPDTPTQQAQDDQSARKLWEQTARLSGIGD